MATQSIDGEPIVKAASHPAPNGAASKSAPLLAGARVAFAIIIGGFGLIGTSGCAHYQLGTGAAPAFRTVFVEPVTNKTLLPQSQTVVSTQLRGSFARDGRLALANSAAAADATLTVVIHEYSRAIAAVREGDTGLARKFNVTLGVICTLRDNRRGVFIFQDRPITAMREVFTDSGQLQAEYQTLPLLAEALAAKIVHAALDVW